METVRSFIAILLEPGIQKNLSELQRRLQYKAEHVKWVKPENIHLTIKFIGDVRTDRIDGIRAALQVAVAGCGPFEMSVAGMGVFPDMRRPRIIWAGVREGEEAVKRIALKIEEACLQLGFSREERGFVAHLTIARVKEMHFPQEFFAKAQKFEEQEFGRMAVSKIALMKSTLTPKGPIYDTICDVVLS